MACALAVMVATGCGSESGIVCLRSDAGEVCVEGGDGRIEFSGRGLEPGSEVRVENDRTDPLTLTVEPDGSLDPGGTAGFLSLSADTEVTFTVTATDDQGDPIVGDIMLST
jgi:hypothetical protein